MNGMHRNADISYSSINAAHNNHRQHNLHKQNVCCCFCSCRKSVKSCFKCCMLKLPYGSITSALLSICGLAISTISLLQSTVITDRILYDLMHRKFLWFSDLKVIYIVISILISVFILINLIIGFATTDQLSSSNEITRRQRNCLYCCSPRSTGTSFLMKIIFLINYLIYYLLLAILIIFLLILFICLLLSSLCYNESKMYNHQMNEHFEFKQHQQNFQSQHQQQINNQYQQQQQQPKIDLRQFNYLLMPLTAVNETDSLYFTGNRLKMLCTDFLSSLTLNIILTNVGLFLLTVGFFNFLINLSVNWTRLTTQQKCMEMMLLLNTAEMTAFGGNGEQAIENILESTTRY